MTQAYLTMDYEARKSSCEQILSLKQNVKNQLSQAAKQKSLMADP